MLVDDGPQVGVDQNGVRGFHVYFTFSAFQLPCFTKTGNGRKP